MQWHALVGSTDPHNFKGSLWDGESPERGNLALPQLEELCRILNGYTSEAAHCVMGLWTGWAWISQGGSRTAMRGGTDKGSTEPVTEQVEPALSAEDLTKACLKLPQRDYLLFNGPLEAAVKIGDPSAPRSHGSQSPNLLWPSDHAWFVASEIDFDSTLVGGSAETVKAILSAPGLDAWPLGPDDSLAADADRVNVVKDESG